MAELSKQIKALD